jgi:glycosyltransferase involved in cell wall biosynthesis
VAYGAGLALWQRRIVGAADAVVVPSEFARARLRELGAGLPEDRVHVLPPPVREAPPPTTDGAELKKESHPSPGRDPGPVPPGSRPYALVVSRLAPEKGVDVAIEACALAGVPLVIAGGGPEGEALRARGAGREVRFVGRVGDGELRALRAGAAIALVPSRSAETFGLAAAEAMAAGVPVAGSRAGALPELIEPAGLADAGDPRGLAGAMGRLLADPGAGARARERVRGLCAPERAAAGLARVYLGEHERP